MASFSFGSVGDIITISLIVKDLIKVLDDSRGSSEEYREIIRELWMLDRALLEVEQLSRACEPTPELNALCVAARGVADTCRLRMETFLGKMKNYSPSLSGNGSSGKIRDASRKIRWHVSHSDELLKFRAKINAHCSSLNLLLSTASLDMIRLSDKKSQERADAITQLQQEARSEQTGILRNIQEAVANNTVLLQSTSEGIMEKMRLAWLTNLGSELKQYMADIFKINTAIFTTVSELRTALPSHLERSLIQEPFMLEDALGRISPVHSQFIDSWDAFDAVIQARFRNQPGYNKIMKKDFVLQERVTRRDISRTEPWERAVHPGQRVDMSIVFTHTHNPHPMYCPACFRVSKTFTRAETQCDGCGLWFGFVVEIVDPVHTKSTSSVQRPDSQDHPGTFNPRNEAIIKAPKVVYENILTVQKPAASAEPGIHSGSSNSAVQLPSSSALHRHMKRKCEDDCLFEQDLSRYKRVRLVSKQDRVRKPITMPGRWKRPRWSVSLQLDMERSSHDTLVETEMICGLHHSATISAMILLANMFGIRREFEIAQRLLERAMTIQSSLRDVPPTLQHHMFESLSLLFMDQNKMLEAEEICRMMVINAETNTESDHLSIIMWQKKLHYVLQLAAKFTDEGSDSVEVFTSMPTYCQETPRDQNRNSCPPGTLYSDNNATSTIGKDVVWCDSWMDGFFPTASLTPSVSDYESENGRTYHAYHAGKYLLPNDEEEQERLDMQHCLLSLALDGKLFLSPIEAPKRILDHGTGTGIWVLDVADNYPAAEVIGTDLSPIQPSWVPPNARFEVEDFDDFEQSWYRELESYDLIHCSLGNAFTNRNWAFFLNESYKHLAHGGWVEIKELHMFPVSPDNSLPKNSAITRWHSRLAEGAAAGNISLRISASDLKERFEEAGFASVTVFEHLLPVGMWPKDEKLKNIGAYLHETFRMGLEAYTVAIFTRYLNWSIAQVNELLDDVRIELRNKSYHWCWTFFDIYGQKPGEDIRVIRECLY